MAYARLMDLKPHQLRQLLRQIREDRGRNKVLAALAVQEKRNVAEIARFFKVSRQTIYNWLDTPKDFILNPRRRHGKPMGRPVKWNKSMDRLLDRCLRKKPFELGICALNWTIPALITCFSLKTGASFSHSTFQRKLHAHKLRWKRPRYRLKPDPELLKKSGISVSE